MMAGRSIRQLVLIALFAGLVTVATMVINIPMVATQGFINVGDTMIFVAGVFLGPVAGFLAGGIGSALADLLLGYVHWAPWTLLIKGLEGFLVGALAHGPYQRHRQVKVGPLLAAGAWMVFGYYLAAGFMRGFPAALASLPGNILQGLGSVVLAVPLLHALRSLDLTERLKDKEH